MCKIMETVDQQISATLDSTDNMSINTYYIYTSYNTITLGVVSVPSAYYYSDPKEHARRSWIVAGWVIDWSWSSSFKSDDTVDGRLSCYNPIIYSVS